MNIKVLTLLLTKQCNFRCKYCYVKYDDNNAMPLEIAKNIILKEMNCVSNNTKLVISFLGGEPFCEFERLKEICEWIWSKHWNIPYYINVVTNGTLITDNIKVWLIQNYKRFYLTLSYDGTMGAQNKNRCDSASVIDIDFFNKYWPNIPVKMTITEDNVSNLYENIVDLSQKGILINDTFADNTSVWQEESLKILDQQLSKLSIYYLSHPSEKTCNLLNIDLTPVLTCSTRQLFDCGAGKNKVTYDADGKKYRCHLLSPLALSKKQLEILDIDINNPKKSNQCIYCILDSICPFCPGMSFLSKKTCWIREDKNCFLFKHQIYYACYYQLKAILKKRSRGEELNEHDKMTYISIKYILSKNAI